VKLCAGTVLYSTVSNFRTFKKIFISGRYPFKVIPSMEGRNKIIGGGGGRGKGGLGWVLTVTGRTCSHRGQGPVFVALVT
jgi:hypothetical protein